MSAGGEPGRVALPAEWSRLERAVEETAASAARWKVRAGETGEEIERLRRSLEAISSESGAIDLAEEVARLRAENEALRGRMNQARKRISRLMQRLAALELES